MGEEVVLESPKRQRVSPQRTAADDTSQVGSVAVGAPAELHPVAPCVNVVLPAAQQPPHQSPAQKPPVHQSLPTNFGDVEAHRAQLVRNSTKMFPRTPRVPWMSSPSTVSGANR